MTNICILDKRFDTYKEALMFIRQLHTDLTFKIVARQYGYDTVYQLVKAKLITADELNCTICTEKLKKAA